MRPHGGHPAAAGRTHLLGLLAGWLLVSACAGPGAVPAEAERADDADFLVPPSAEPVLLTIAAATLPEWRTTDGCGSQQSGRELRAIVGRSVLLLLLTDRPATLEIPAMRVRIVGVPDRYQRAWFTPLRPGEYEVLVRSGADRFDGKLLVARDDAR